MGFITDVTDIVEIAVQFDGTDRELKSAVSAVTRKAALDIVRDAKSGAPVDTGNLRSTIGAEFETDGDSITAEIGVGADYAAHVEFGHVIVAWGRRTDNTQPPRPYLIPAFDRNAPSYIAALEAVLDTVIK